MTTNEGAFDRSDRLQASDDSPEPIELVSLEGSPSSPKRPRIWPVFVVPLCGLFLAIGLQAAVGAVLGVVVAARGVIPSQISTEIMQWITTPVGFLAMLACGQIGFFLVTIFAAQRSPEPLKHRLGIVPLRNPVWFSTIVALGSIVPLAIALGCVHLVLQFIPADGTILKFYENITLGWSIVFVIAVALAPGFFEEMLFRGYIQRRLLQRWSPPAAIGTATLLFTLAHITPHAMAVAFPLGIWFGIIAWRVGSIFPTIACHAFVNGGVNAWRMVIKFGELSESSQLIGNCFFFAIGVVCFAVSCRMLAGYQPPELTPSSELFS